MSASLKCQKRGCAGHVLGTPDRIGRLIWACDGCARRSRGICQDCPGTITGRAWRCRACSKTHRTLQWHLSDERNREARRKRNREACRRMSPEKRADRVAAKKAWRDANPLKVMLQKRRGRKTGTWGYATREKYLEAMARQNRRPGRAEKRRLAAKAQNVYFAARPSCRECGGEVVWSGLGRPRLRCDSCRSQKVAA